MINRLMNNGDKNNLGKNDLNDLLNRLSNIEKNISKQ
jgi:hypothetical protein